MTDPEAPQDEAHEPPPPSDLADPVRLFLRHRGGRTMSDAITRMSAQDWAELATFSRFLVERAAHRELERAAGMRLPFRPATVPEEWWNPPHDGPSPSTTEGI